MDTRQPTESALLDDSALSEALSNLGFDQATDWSILAAATAPISVWIHRQCLDLADHRRFVLEYRLIVAAADRDGDILYPDRETTDVPRIIAAQVTGIHEMGTREGGPRLMFEKTYAIGTPSVPEKSQMLADVVNMVERYSRQLQQCNDFFEASAASR